MSIPADWQLLACRVDAAQDFLDFIEWLHKHASSPNSIGSADIAPRALLWEGFGDGLRCEFYSGISPDELLRLMTRYMQQELACIGTMMKTLHALPPES